MERGSTPEGTASSPWTSGFSARRLLSTVESSLLGPSPPSPSQRVDLMRAIRSALPAFKSLLTYPTPKAADRAQVQSKDVRLPDSAPISLDDTDVKIALKLSDELNLNEIECVNLLISTNQEWVLLGREPLEIFRLAAGLWYTERRDLITSLYTLFRAVLLDQGLDADLVADIQSQLEDLLTSNLRQRLITLIKELNREDSTGFGGPNADAYVIDSRGAPVERKAVVCRERLSLGHCLVFSLLIVRLNPRDVKDIFSALKDSAAEVNTYDDSMKLQITFSLLFSLFIAFLSDALSTVPDKASVLSHDNIFRREFQDIVMAPVNNPSIEGFIDIVRLGWTVHLLLNREQGAVQEMTSIHSCLELICSNNVFKFLLSKVVESAAYQNDDEDMVCVYTAYLHKLMMCFLSHPLGKDKAKEMKEMAMIALSPYITSLSDDLGDGTGRNLHHSGLVDYQPFVSLLELLDAIYQKEPELSLGNEGLWTFVNFAGEGHTNIRTLVAFLGLLSTLACTEEGASKVYELLQGMTFRSISWNTLFECLSIYDQKFKQAFQSAGTVFPEFQEGDAKALVAYLHVLEKVMGSGNPNERKNWFKDIEPLFKLLSYENVPPYVKGALRDAISAFIPLSPVMKQSIWSYLEQYDLPVVVGPSVGMSMTRLPAQIYDMQYELNEVEARLERYPSTVSFLNLINNLIAKETDASDRGRRFVGIFRFVYDHVFGSFTQRAYADECEKWKLAIACLRHFKMILGMYDVKDEDAVQMPPSSKSHHLPLDMQLPVLELLKDFMCGKTAFRNVMGILSWGVNSVIQDRASQIYGQYLETAICLCLEIIVLVLERDLFLADHWRPVYQTLDVILSQDHNHIVTLLEYVRYNFLPQIQQCSIKIMSILSSRLVGLVQLLVKRGVAKYLIEDYAACLDLRMEESVIMENVKDDTGILIMQLLLDNISCPAPNMSHLLLKFDMDSPIEETILQPKLHYSCLKVVLDALEMLPRPKSNCLLFEFGFQLMYELCLDPLTNGPVMELLSSRRYLFFAKHLETIAVAPLPKRSNNQALRISSLHQRAWLLKLLALELHVADISVSAHRDTCLGIISWIFARGTSDAYHPGAMNIQKNKVLELLEVVLFRLPETVDYSQVISNLKCDLRVDDILKNPATSERGGLYYYSDRGDRLIDLAAFQDQLWKMYNFLKSESNALGSVVDMNLLRESIQQLLRWGWKYNKNLEEQAAQLHMLVGWCHVVEVTVSKRMAFLDDRTQVLFELLDYSLSAASSPDCSLKFALILSQAALTCMAKLRDERFLFPGGIDSDNITCLDVIVSKGLPNGACQSILFKMIMCIIRNESSELLRRRLYALLLCYFQYCSSILDPDVPASIMHPLLHEQTEVDDIDLHKIDREHADLVRENFSILTNESQAIFDVVTKDLRQGSEASKALSLSVLDVLISIDQDRFFLSQMQSRGILRSCLSDISNFSSQGERRDLDSLQRLCTLEAKFSLLLRISHKYKKLGGEVLLSMGVLEHLMSFKVVEWHLKGSLRRSSRVHGDARDTNRQRHILSSILRLVACLTSLVDLSNLFEVKNKIVHEVVDFVKSHQSVLDQILTVEVQDADEDTLEQINLVVSILSKVWPYEESDQYGFIQQLFILMHSLFPFDISMSTNQEKQKKLELTIFHIMLGLSSYLYFLVRKKCMRLKVAEISGDGGKNGEKMQPTLLLVVRLLKSSTNMLERASEEKSLLLGKIQDINELSRQEVDATINMFLRQDCISMLDNIRKRRYIAMVEMCRMIGIDEQLISLALQLAEHGLNILLTHFEDTLMDYGNTHDRSLLCGKVLPIFERLEQLKEEKAGHNLKVIHRSVGILKEMVIRNLAS